MNPTAVTRTAIAGLAVAVVGLVANAQGAAAASPSTPSPTNTEASLGQLQRNTILAQPSVVFIERDESGFLRNTTTGKLYSDIDASGAFDGKPLVVSALGTGFFVSNSGDIVTASHVATPTDDQTHLDLVDALISAAYGCGDCAAEKARHEADLLAGTTVENLQVGLTVYTQDEAGPQKQPGYPATVLASSPTAVHDTAVIKVALQNTPAVQLANSDTVNVQDSISVIGYPADSLELSNNQTVLVPTISSGTITARKQSGLSDIANNTDVLQTDVPVEHGNSGGPAIAADGKVVGLVSFGASAVVNFLIQSNDVAGVMTDAKVGTAGGSVDQLWREGFQAYLDGRYTTASQTLGQCAALSKIQIGCAQFASKARALIPTETKQPTAPSGFPHRLIITVAAGAVALLALVLVTIVVWRIRRRRHANPASPEMATNGSTWAFAANLGDTLPAINPRWVFASSDDAS